MDNLEDDIFGSLLKDHEPRQMYYWEFLLKEMHISINEFCVRTKQNQASCYNWAIDKSSPILKKAFKFQMVFNTFTGQNLTLDELWKKV